MTVYDDFVSIEKQNVYTNKNINFNIEKNEKLYIVSCVFSPFGKDIRTKLAQEFIHHIEELKEKGHPVEICVVELLYPNQHSLVELKEKKNHLQIQYEHDIYIFNKENLINVGVENLLPNDWKWMAWIDADIEFLDEYWVEKTIQLFKDKKLDIIQLFSICRFLNEKKVPSQYFYSSIHILHNTKLLEKKKYRHPGFAWACSREAYNTMGGLFEYAIVGGGDMIMECCFTNRIHLLEKKYSTLDNFYKKIQNFHNKVKEFKLGYINVIIQHYYHGERKNRQYVDRNQILIHNQFDPDEDVIKPFSSNKFSFIIPVVEFYKKIQNQIQSYFEKRKEI